MGRITPILGQERGLKMERSSTKYQANLRSRSFGEMPSNIALAKKSGSSPHPLHVYRHVDIEKLESKAPHGATTLNLGGARSHTCFSLQAVHHAKHTRIAEQALGGALWFA